MIFKKSKVEDLARIMEILNYGKEVQKSSGNQNQWSDNYPVEADVLSDIDKGQSYIGINEETGEIVVTLCILEDEEPTYEYIDGAWLNDEKYVTVHRIASIQPGSGKLAIEYVLENYKNVRIDTHVNNKQMLRLIEKLGFVYCGVVTMMDGSLRNAYQHKIE